MTIIVFLVDTSASMNQRTYAGTTLLDVAKNSVELFMKERVIAERESFRGLFIGIRSRDQICRWDRYMLLTFEDPPSNVKAGWKETHSQFMKELKSLEAFSLTSMGPALKNTFDLLNTNRGQTGIDTYGQGRSPFFLEPAIIICITDGDKITHKNGATNELTLPMNTSTLLGGELTKEPFRWDQRLYGVVLRMEGIPSMEQQQQTAYLPSAEGSCLDAMCEVTGGRSYNVTSHKVLMQCLEHLVTKCQSGVVVSFELLHSQLPPSSSDSNQSDRNSATPPGSNTTTNQTPAQQPPPSPPITPQPWHNTRRMIFVPRSVQRGGSVGYWPIPEAFWPDPCKENLPPRSAHPVINFSTHTTEPPSFEALPFDKYELELSPLTQYILEKRNPNMAWQVYVSNSGRYSDLGHPFGYLKANTSLSAVNLVVMPYNYPLFISLMDDLIRVQRMKPSCKWKMQWDAYLKSVPPYYAKFLKQALSRMNLAINLIPEQMDNCLSYNVVSHLKKIKNQAKMEFERSVASVQQNAVYRPIIRVTARPKNPTPLTHLNHFLTQPSSSSSPSKLDSLLNGGHSTTTPYSDPYDNFTLHADPKSAQLRVYTNPFDIQRESLLETLKRMRLNFLNCSKPALKYKNTEYLHNQPVAEMGNYQEHLKKTTPPLRDIENTPTRINTFGNPFKVKNMMIDVADEAMPGSPSSSSSSSSSTRKRPMSEANKRKPGPLPKSFCLRDFMQSLSSPPSPVSSPPSSPSSSPSSSRSSPCPSPFSDISDKRLNNNIINNTNNKSNNSTTILTNGITKSPSKTSPKSSPTPSNRLKDFLVSLNLSNLLQDPLTDLQFNTSLRNLALIEIRKPGNKFNNVATLMTSLRGEPREQRWQLERAIFEAKRFKKQPFIDKLTAHLSSLT